MSDGALSGEFICCECRIAKPDNLAKRSVGLYGGRKVCISCDQKVEARLKKKRKPEKRISEKSIRYLSGL